MAYRAERERQEEELETITHGYAADAALYFARGGAPLINFRRWLEMSAR
ncbi:MAG: hypothetical protein M3Q39_15890 [Actinomycetota bacterium]|nr:hypothetical protein [Actinomycetota bacterium]